MTHLTADAQEKLILSTQDFYHFLDMESVVYCQSDNSYTTFYLTNGEKITISVSLKSVEQQLSREQFVRSHQSYIINICHIKAIDKKADWELTLSNGAKAPVSSRRKKEITRILDKFIRIQN